MISRYLKLNLYKAQETQLLEWLWNLTSVYNWAIKHLEINIGVKRFKVYDKIKEKTGKITGRFLPLSTLDFQNSLSGVSKKINIPSHTIQGVLLQANNAWDRCFKKISKKPRKKGKRNKLNSIPFPDPIKPPKGNRILIPGIGETRFFKQDIPEGKIKHGRIIKKASGWYLVIDIDASYKPKTDVKKTGSQAGGDTGFGTLLTLSDGTKYENPRELRKGALRLAQSQRGGDKNLSARVHERQANRRKDRNHKISAEVVKNHDKIYLTNDNLVGQAKRFGKSTKEASIGQLRNFISYKGSSCGREVVLVESRKSTMTCSACGAETGPKGLSGLKVRHWECSACGAVHDRDTNSAMFTLIVGAGCALSLWGNLEVKPEPSVVRGGYQVL